MISQIFIHVLILMVALLWLVPRVTEGGVAVRRGSVFLGGLALLVIALANHVFWHLMAATGFAAIPLTLVGGGVLGWLINSVAIRVVGAVLPGVLYVRSFGSAMGASLILILAGFLAAVVL